MAIMAGDIKKKKYKKSFVGQRLLSTYDFTKHDNKKEKLNQLALERIE